MDDREKNSDELIQELSELRWKNRELEDEVQELRSQAAAGEKEQWVQLERDKFYSLAEASPFGLVVTSQDGTYEYINPRFTEMFGYELSDLPNGSAWLRNAYPNENYRKEAVDAWFEDLKRTKQGDLRPRIFTVRCKDGTDKVIQFRPVQLSTGQDLMTCEDITEYTKIDNDLKQANLETNALLESARSIIENSDFRTAAQFILTSANKLVGSTVGHIILLNSEGSEQSLMYFESGGLPCDVDPKAPISVTGFHALAYEKKRAFYKNDLLSGIPILELPKNHVHLENFLLSPLIVRNKALGLLGLANKPGGFTEGDAKLVESFSEVLAVGLLNWRAKRRTIPDDFCSFSLRDYAL
ncbi:MAG: GAF domain-containing protein [Deltaproteobacteria bacterium]|nr:GAF domain-containing protein [Deltaproteobacteria bacterium]